MLLKLGVDISRLNRPIRRQLRVIDNIFARNGFEAVITSTYEGLHSPSSLHYCNDAIDLRLPKSKEKAEDILAELKSQLDGFDVILEKNHFHIEYDPV